MASRETQLTMFGGDDLGVRSTRVGEPMRYDDPEFTSGELIAFTTMPVGQLADWFYSFVDIDPSGRLAKTKQLKGIIRQRKLTYPELSAAWETLRDEMRSLPCT